MATSDHPGYTLYTEQTVKDALAQMAYPPRYNHWVWDAHPHVLSYQPSMPLYRHLLGRESVFRYELWRYCWAIYRLTSTDIGNQVLGREDATDSFSPSTGHEKYRKINARWATVAGAAGINLMPGGRGNALKMDKWHPYMNDFWLLGGVHRHAPFRLVSTANPVNIWNFKEGYLVVTARELLGLKHFGYEPLPGTSTADIVFVPTDRNKANRATLQSYNEMLTRKAHLGKDIINELIDVRIVGLNDAIQNFDRGTLRPPRHRP